MNDERSEDGRGYFKRFKRATSAAAADERDVKIERLEQALVEEQAKSATLQRELDQLSFQHGVLERSYSKQLDDARHSAETAEQSLVQSNAKLAGLTADYDQATESLKKTQTDLQRVTAERDRLRRVIEGEAPEEHAESGEEADLPEGTINRLLADLPSHPKRRLRGEKSPIDGDDEKASSHELLSPDLVFQNKDDDES